MGVNIGFLPGIFGSLLGYPAPNPSTPRYAVWISPYSALSGQLIQLQLAADGVSPGPLTSGIPLQVLGYYPDAYEVLVNFMTALGWNVVPCPFDWRVSALVSAPAIYQALQAAFGLNPFVLVCHSQGGLVARAVYRLMAAGGIPGQCKGIITLGTPHYGSWAIQQGFQGQQPLYRKLQFAAGWVGPFVPGFRPDFIDACLASWPGWYELTPFRDYGPLWQSDPATAAALYRAATYAGGNPYILQKWLDAAAATQDILNGFPAPALVRCITGTGYHTAVELNPGTPMTQENGFAYTEDGDDTVPRTYASYQGSPAVSVNLRHGDLCRDPRSWPAIAWCVQTLLGPGALPGLSTFPNPRGNF